MINGIYAASLSILNENLAIDYKRTISHAEELIDNGCHGVVFFGSTGQSQLISLGEKIQLINHLPSSKYKEKFIIGTGLNSLSDTISLMKISKTLNFDKFLIMPPAYYKYGDEDVVNFYSKLIKEVGECKIILYNFEKLSGYKFSKDCIKKLVDKFPNKIINVELDNFTNNKEAETKRILEFCNIEVTSDFLSFNKNTTLFNKTNSFLQVRKKIEKYNDKQYQPYYYLLD